MADIAEAGLPVKSPGNTDDKTEVQIVDGTTVSQKATVDSDNNLHVQVHGDNPSSGDEVLRLSELGAPNPDGDYDGTNNTKPAHVGLIAHDRAATPADTDQNQRLTAKTGTTDTDVHALDVSLHDENGNSFSNSNPLPVSVDVDGTPTCDYDTASSVASAATSNHDLSVANNTTAKLCGVIGSASGRAKWELQIGDGAVSEAFSTCAVQFSTESSPSVFFDLSCAPQDVVGTANTTTIRLIRTNRDDDDAQDLYSSFIYNLVS